MQFPGIGPFYCPCGCKKFRAILVNLYKIIGAQIHFHATIDIKPQMDGTNDQNAMKHFQYSFAT